MRLGAYIGEFTSPREWAQIHVQNGYGAAYWPFDKVAHDADDAVIQSYVDAARDHGLLIAEVGAWCNPLDRDPEIRDKNIAYIIGQLKLADRVGARCCVNIAGSLSSTSWRGPHPENLSDENFGRIVEITQQIIDSAAPRNTYFAHESMPWLFPHDIESTRRMLRAVNRSAFAVHVDMTNMINSFDKVYHTGEITRNFFREFAPLIRSVHAKDIILEDGLSVRIQEVVPGRGLFNHDALLNECAGLDADLPVMLEHLETQDEYLEGKRHLEMRAKENKLDFVRGYYPEDE